MNRKRDLSAIGKTYQDILDKKLSHLWILFLYYDHSNTQNHKFKLMPFDDAMPPKWVSIFKSLKRQQRPAWMDKENHIITFEGKQKPHAGSKKGYYMRTAHVSDKESLKQILREAFAGDIQEEDDVIDNMKPETRRHFGDIFTNL